MDRIDEIRSKIEHIDDMFQTASGWGSWMVMASNDRYSLVEEAARLGYQMEHKYVAKDGSGNRVHD
jgi:hypothetical protein